MTQAALEKLAREVYSRVGLVGDTRRAWEDLARYDQLMYLDIVDTTVFVLQGEPMSLDRVIALRQARDAENKEAYRVYQADPYAPGAVHLYVTATRRAEESFTSAVNILTDREMARRAADAPGTQVDQAGGYSEATVAAAKAAYGTYVTHGLRGTPVENPVDWDDLLPPRQRQVWLDVVTNAHIARGFPEVGVCGTAEEVEETNRPSPANLYIAKVDGDWGCWEGLPTKDRALWVLAVNTAWEGA